MVGKWRLGTEPQLISHQKDWHNSLNSEVIESIKTKWLEMHPDLPRRIMAEETKGRLSVR